MYIMTIVVVVAARVVEVGIDAVLVRWGFRPAALWTELPFLFVCVCACGVRAEMEAL